MRSALAVTGIAIALLSNGCMKVHIDTVIVADGSGTAAVSFGMNRQVADAVARLGDLDDGGGDEQDLAALTDLDRDELAAACAEAGVRVVSHAFTDDITGVTFELELSFDRVADLSHALSTLSSDAVARPGEELRIIHTEADEYLLANAAIEGAEIPEPAADANRPSSPEFLMNFMVLLDHVDELDIRRTITVPGEVISSNAREVEGRTSIWVINAANMLEEDDSGLDPHIVFAAEGVEIPAPDVR